MRFLKLVFFLCAALYLIAALAVFVFQRRLQYFPSHRDPAPGALGLSGVIRQTLATADGESLVLWYTPPAKNRPVILFLHGNAGEIADRTRRLGFYQSRGFGTAFLSWRGYGGSSGSPSEVGLVTDAQTAYDHLQSLGHRADHIVLVGESLGTGPAVQIAARNPVAALILEAPFSAAVDIAKSAYPWLPVSLLMKDQYRSRDYITRVQAPLLILHGDNDRVIPQPSGKALFQAANNPKTFIPLGPVGHEATDDPVTWTHEVQFLDRLFP